MSLRNQIEQIIRESKPHKGVLQGARKMAKGQPGKCINFFPSVKNDALMPCESRLEADHCMFLEYDTDVEIYRTQPLTLDLGAYGKYTPDVALIDQAGKIELREVKISGSLENPHLQKFLSWLETYLKDEHIRFQVITEKLFQRSPQRENFRYLYRASHLHFDEILVQQAIHILHELGGKCRFRTYRTAIQEAGLPVLLAERLLFKGIATYDTGSLLGPESIVCIGSANGARCE